MNENQMAPALPATQKRFKGSLARTLVGTLVIFIIIPLSIMAGLAYYRAHNVLREQAVNQSQSLIVTQLGVVDQEVNKKEARLQHLIGSSDFAILMELALHANPMSQEFKEIRASVAEEFENLNSEQNAIAFDQFILMDLAGNIKISSNLEWQGQTISDVSILHEITPEDPSFLTYRVAPVFYNQLSLLTILEYNTAKAYSSFRQIHLDQLSNK